MLIFKHSAIGLLILLLMSASSRAADQPVTVCAALLVTMQKNADEANDYFRKRQSHGAVRHMIGNSSSASVNRLLNVLRTGNPDEILWTMLEPNEAGVMHINGATSRYRSFILKNFRTYSSIRARTSEDAQKSLLTEIIAATEPSAAESAIGYLTRIHERFLKDLAEYEKSAPSDGNTYAELENMRLLRKIFPDKDPYQIYELQMPYSTIFSRFLDFEIGTAEGFNIFNPTYLLLAELYLINERAFRNFTTANIRR